MSIKILNSGIALGVVVLFLTACWNPGASSPKIISLPGGYSIWTSSMDTTFLTKGDVDTGASFVLGPHIQSWERKGRYLVGEVVDHVASNPDLQTSPEDVGFFIFDLVSGQLLKGLKRTDYLEKLKSMDR